MRVLVIGAGGFIGVELVNDLLARGFKVKAVDNFYKGNRDALLHFATHPNFNFHNKTVVKPNDCRDMVKGVDAILNLSGIVGVGACDKDPCNAWGVNRDAIKFLLDARNEISQNIPFITCSTDSVFGIVEQTCNEETPPNPQSIYGESKLAGERIALGYENTIALRFSTGCGTSSNLRINLLVNDLVVQAVTKKELSIYEPDVYRTFIHVKDMSRSLIHFLLLLAEKHNQYNLYCVGDDRMNFTKRELALMIQAKTGCKVVFNDNGSDPDKRNYKCSHVRCNTSAGFYCNYMMDQTLDELIKVVPLLWLDNNYQ